MHFASRCNNVTCNLDMICIATISTHSIQHWHFDSVRRQSMTAVKFYGKLNRNLSSQICTQSSIVRCWVLEHTGCSLLQCLRQFCFVFLFLLPFTEICFGVPCRVNINSNANIHKATICPLLAVGKKKRMVRSDSATNWPHAIRTIGQCVCALHSKCSNLPSSFYGGPPHSA